jgi:hypothetical protein
MRTIIAWIRWLKKVSPTRQFVSVSPLGACCVKGDLSIRRQNRPLPDPTDAGRLPGDLSIFSLRQRQFYKGRLQPETKRVSSRIQPNQ